MELRVYSDIHSRLIVNLGILETIEFVKCFYLS